MDTTIYNNMEQDNKNSTDLVKKGIDPISYFSADGDFVLVYKKTEKLASALYMITNLFSDSEPMKWTMRKKVSELLSFMISYKDIQDGSRYDFVYNVKTQVLELVSFLEVSFRGGLVSQMNFSILKQEFSNLIDMLSVLPTQATTSSYETFSKSFFDVSRGDFAQKAIVSSSVFPADQTFISPVQKPVNQEMRDKSFVVSNEDLKKSNRQNIILNLLKKKKELTIKDIALVIKDCSEKTIQRELNSFIVAGVLKRAGVRRWSKYSLV